MAIKVKATAVGYHGTLREVGHEFEIQSEKQFSKRWMEKLEDDKKGKAKKADSKAAADEAVSQGDKEVI